MYHIREAAIDDCAAIAEIEQLQFTHPWTLSQIMHEVGFMAGCVFVASDETNHVIGYVFGSLTIDTAELLRIAVHPEFTKKHIASRLLVCFLNELTAKDAAFIFLEVNENNTAAREFYKKNGFAELNRRKNYYPDGDAVVMKKDL